MATTSPSGAGLGDVEHRIIVPAHLPVVAILGPGDEVLRAVEAGFPRVRVHARGDRITLTGPPADVGLVTLLLDELLEVAATGTPLTADVVARSVRMLTAATASRPAEVLTQNILSSRGRTIRPKTVNQKTYVDAIDRNTITFGIGPAGTGKTYLAMAKAVQALQGKQVNRIVLTRPAVEAGERLGFLPGTLSEKIDPYLRPLSDALNTSTEQMKMFLTRLGFGSRMVVTGDVTQVDLPGGTRSGLRVVEEILNTVDDVAFCRLTSEDVVRHRLVADIIDAYGVWDVRSADRGSGSAR